MPKVTWQFPPNDAGEIEGPNDPGISHFTDNRNANLIRESIQNSLDARAGEDPVSIEFDLVDIPRMGFEADQLSEILDDCIQSPHNYEEYRDQFRKGKNLLRRNQQVRGLCIQDSNTTGAGDTPRDGGAPSKWQALTKGSGSPVKDQKDSAGSFGLGKHSAFAVTDLRTVLYSTTWRDEDGLRHSRFIGKSILVSHTYKGKSRRRTGYLSGEHYMPLRDGEVPSTFLLRQPGTAIYIVGYAIEPGQGSPEWKRDSIAAAVEGYFHAITHRNLIVRVSDEEVNSDNIVELFAAGTHYRRKYPRTANFIQVSQMMPAVRKHFPGVGDVSLRIKVHDDPKPKVREIALVRDSGMMITDQLNVMGLSLGRIPVLWRGFTAIIECKSELGKSSYIRDSESPKHDKISVDYIDDPDRKRQARNTLREVGQWIRQQIEERVGPYTSVSDDYVDELAKYLPIYDDGGKPIDPNKPATISMTPPKRSRNVGGGAGPFGGEHGGRRRRRRKVVKPSNGGDGPGGRGGGTGGRGDGRRPPRTRVSGVRIRPVLDETHSVSVTFDNPRRELVNIQLVAVGEDGARLPLYVREARAGQTLLDTSNGAISRLPATDDARYQLEIRTIEPVAGKTFRLLGGVRENTQEQQGNG